MIDLQNLLPPKMERYQLKSPCLLMIVMILGLAASRHCDHHHFWNSKHHACHPCSKCPKNEIIRKPCGRHTDTVCGPFREFNFFNQLDELDPPSYTSYDYEMFFDENSGARDGTGDHHWGVNEGQNEPIVQKDDGEYWKNLAFALIGVVCVLIFVATIVVLMACRKLHETAAVKRPEEEEDDDSGLCCDSSHTTPEYGASPTSVFRHQSHPCSHGVARGNTRWR
ncbi:uncharacterized protein LOC143286879 isoform X1 [Babylonia areolata]|uniref:uncharacterized protein LOC143286879 isoform X1 n=1 Tax=Babylonia areolata TaxID=304850 RepID=UPI003FCFA649